MSQMLRWMGCGFVVGAVTALGAGHAMSQDAGGGPGGAGGADLPDLPGMAEMMKRHEDAVTPGPGHERLNPFIGDWTTTTRVWWMGPGSEPLVTEGQATQRWICDGRFVLTEATGEFMMPGADGTLTRQSTRMFSFTGYDNFRQLYVGAHVSNLGTHLQTYQGNADQSGRTFTYYGEMDEPMLGVVGRLVKFEIELIDDDSYVFRVFDLHVGADYKVVEVSYRRK